MAANLADDNFKCIFLNENIWIWIWISLKFRTNEQCSSIVLDNGLASTKRQPIIWTNDGLGYQRIYASLGLNELLQMFVQKTIKDGIKENIRATHHWLFESTGDRWFNLTKGQ